MDLLWGSFAMTDLYKFEDPGTDTSQPLTVMKRVAIMDSLVPLKGLSVLDGGCGSGGYVLEMLDRGVAAQGVEFEKQKVDIWTRKYPGDDRVRVGDLQALGFHPETFDVVILNEVLEHVDDQDKALTEVMRVLKPGGHLFLFSPNRFHPFETHGFISARTGKNTGLVRTFGLPYLPDHLRSSDLRAWALNYWPSELRQLVKKHGFHVKQHRYVWQTLENISGNQRGVMKAISPTLRPVFALAEKIPLVRRLGVSQLIFATKH
jgi:2-polyprenyl-3-methyl-5-hydroxy-6-metoxy-1,4-benzoquinol methylase